MSTTVQPSIYDLRWTPAEKKIARHAFDVALGKHTQTIRAKVKKMVESDSTSVWQIHDYLTVQRKQIDQIYDYRYSRLIVVFARLLRDGWLDLRNLEGLAEEKIREIKSIAER